MPTTTDNQPRRGIVPPQIVDLVVPPLQFGGWCGVAGAITGAGAAIMSDASPFISGTSTGLHWASVGTTYWFTRGAAIRYLGGEQEVTPFGRVQASLIAGLPSGALAAVARKSKAVPSSMLVYGLAAAGGQVAVNLIAGQKRVDKEEHSSSWLSSPWSPLQKLSDEEYVSMMQEKILRVDADIALIDDRIAKLREEQQEKGGEPR